MYIRITERETKKDYREILELGIDRTLQNQEMFPNALIFKSIYNQLVDVKENIVKKQTLTDEDDIYDRYDFGAIAVKNFDGEEYGQILMDIFYGALRYQNFSEK